MHLIWELACFWARCLLDGFVSNFTVFGEVDTVCVLIAVILHVHKARCRNDWKWWEPWVMRFAYCILLGTFGVSILIINPFLQYRDAKTRESPAPAAFSITTTNIVIVSGGEVSETEIITNYGGGLLALKFEPVPHTISISGIIRSSREVGRLYTEGMIDSWGNITTNGIFIPREHFGDTVMANYDWRVQYRTILPKQ